MPADLKFFDEMSEATGSPRHVYRRLAEWLEHVPPGLLASRRAQADLLFRRIGITFAVYGDKDATERLIPFDLVPRLIARSEWARLEAGLIQRVKALNMFLADLSGPREVVRAGQAYKPTTNGLIVTGDGIAQAYRIGARLMDMR